MKRTLFIGIVFQIVLVACGYFRPAFQPGLLFACMMTAAVAGMLYGRDLARGFLAGMMGGAMIGAACAWWRCWAPAGWASIRKPLSLMASWC